MKKQPSMVAQADLRQPLPRSLPSLHVPREKNAPTESLCCSV